MKPKLATIKYHLGIDVSKKDFHVALLRLSDREITVSTSFENTVTGHRKLIQWLGKHTEVSLPVHACMEATGSYGDQLAIFLHNQLNKVSVVNPCAIKNYAAMKLRRNKSDKADARLIAQYSADRQPEAWQAPSKEQIRLKATARRIGQLQHLYDMERNHLEAALEKNVRKDIEAMMKSLKDRIDKNRAALQTIIEGNPALAQMLRLITSIKGIGTISGVQIIAELPDLNNFENARALGAYAGITPRHFQSGTSGKARTPMTKTGSKHLRRHLFFPALTAMRFNPICKAMADRLTAKGKGKMEIIGAIMHKLLHIIYGVLKTEKPFDADYLKKNEKNA
jgi:transposase